MIHVTTWMNLVGIIFSKLKHINDNIPCNSIYMKFKNRQKKKDGDRSQDSGYIWGK